MLLLNRLIIISITVIALTACAADNNTIDPAKFDASSHARIRLYGQNQKPSIMEYSQGNHKVHINTGGSISDALLSFIGSPKNQSLGIPATTMSTNMANYNGILSKLFYQEFIIPANTPITVNNAFDGITTVLYNHPNSHHPKTIYTESSCESDKVTFTAEAGKDYEVVPAYNSAQCGVVVLQINKDGSTEMVANQQ